MTVMDCTTLLVITQTLLPFIISPGASFALTVSASGAGIPYAALKVWAGTAAGIALLASAAALGVARFIMDNPLAQSVLSVLGGILLIMWGIRLCLPAANGGKSALPAHLTAGAFLLLIGNIKAVLLYAAVLPARLGAHHPAVFYSAAAALHIAMLLIWLVGLEQCVRRLPADILQRPLRYISGAFMIWLGGKSLWTAW